MTWLGWFPGASEGMTAAVGVVGRSAGMTCSYTPFGLSLGMTAGLLSLIG